jgi:branched-chain amino acid transport system ATP-binding protein
LRPDAEGAPKAPALELEGIRAAYGRIEVIHGVDLTLPAGSVFALLGPNGAGKSTLLKVVSGRMHPSAGSVRVDGRDVTKRSCEYLARHGVCAIPEGRGVFVNLSVSENLRMWTFRGKLRHSEVEERAYARFPRLGERRKQLAGTLSGGEQQMLAMSRALSTNPSLLLIDEISMGLAPIIVSELYDVVAQLATEGISILIVEQFAQMALSVSSRAAIMTHGRIERVGSPAEVGEAMAEVYLRGAQPA